MVLDCVINLALNVVCVFSDLLSRGFSFKKKTDGNRLIESHIF